MKRYEKRGRDHSDRDRIRKRTREQRGGFKCCHCRTQVVINSMMGTANRNHCNLCLWSKHVDEKKGDRLAMCQAGMRPVGLTFRLESHGRRGEIMLIHVCSGCAKISINRIAADDIDTQIVDLFRSSMTIDEALRRRIVGSGIRLALRSDAQSISSQLYGAGTRLLS